MLFSLYHKHKFVLTGCKQTYSSEVLVFYGVHKVDMVHSELCFLYVWCSITLWAALVCFCFIVSLSLSLSLSYFCVVIFCIHMSVIIMDLYNEFCLFAHLSRQKVQNYIHYTQTVEKSILHLYSGKSFSWLWWNWACCQWSVGVLQNLFWTISIQKDVIRNTFNIGFCWMLMQQFLSNLVRC